MNFRNIMNNIKSSALGNKLFGMHSSSDSERMSSPSGNNTDMPAYGTKSDDMPGGISTGTSATGGDVMPSRAAGDSDWVLHTSGGEMPDPDRTPADRYSVGESGISGSESDTDLSSSEGIERKKAA